MRIESFPYTSHKSFIYQQSRLELSRYGWSIEVLECDRFDITQQELIRSEMATCELLRPDLSAHKNNIGDAEADCHQAEQGSDVRPDEVEALAKLQWSGQDALGLTLQGQTENPGRRI